MPAARSRVLVLVALFVTPDPDHHRRAAVGHRHRRHGPAGAASTCWPCRAARSRRRATSTRCCSTRPAPSRSATARRPSSSRCRASTERELAEAAQLASLADETPEGRSIVVLAKEKYGIRGREMAPLHAELHSLHRADAHERRRRRRRVDPQGRGRRGARRCRPGARRRIAPPSSTRDRRAHRQAPAARRWPWREDGALLGVIHLKDIVKGGIRERFADAAPDGHPHRDDHRRQPADRRRHRRRGRRRRLPRPGDAGGQARS